MVTYVDRKYRFFELFDEKTGFLLRSNVMENNRETSTQPQARSFPELIDIGIMGYCHCVKKPCKESGVDCYQNANRQKPNMGLSDYIWLVNQCKGATFQVALGGAGDPNKHEDFEGILHHTRQMKIIPNLTTSGMALADSEIELIKKYCGAVAVSLYSRLTRNCEESNAENVHAISRLVEAGCTTNIHFVLSKKSISEAHKRVERGLFPKGTNAIVFLLYKPVGLGISEQMLSYTDEEYISFLRLLDSKRHTFKFGFDTCQAPALHQYCDFISSESIEACEAGRFSMYIDSELNAYPCSFSIEECRTMISLRKHSIKEAWESDVFMRFRDKAIKKCSHCDEVNCHNCPLALGINVCGKLVG